MSPIYLIPRLFVLIFISLFFIACDNNDSSINNPVSSSFYPLAVNRVTLDDSTARYLNKDILVEKFFNDNNISLQIKRININEENKLIDTITTPYFIENVAIDDVVSALNNGILVNNYSEDNGTSILQKLDVYKIEDNNSVVQLSSTILPKEMKDGESPWLISGVSMSLKDNLLTIHQIVDYSDSTINEVILYRQDENNSFHYLQTLKSDDNLSRFTNFGAAIDIDEDRLAITEYCKLNIFVKDENSSLFSKTDTYTFDGRYCDLSPSFSQNHILVYNHVSRKPTQDLLCTFDENNTISDVKDVSDTNVSSHFGSDQIVTGNKVLIAREKGFALYEIEDVNSSTTLTKIKDINLSYTPYDVQNGATTFLTKISQSSLFMEYFEMYPNNQIYILSDTNSSISIDEGNIYPFYTINVTSIHDPIHYSLSGEDSDYFEIVNNAIVPKKALSYANPLDSNGDNIYEIVLHISDAIDQSKSVVFHVSVKNHDYVTAGVSYSDDLNTSLLNLGTKLFLNKKDLVVGAYKSIYLFQVDENNLTQISKASTADFDTTGYDTSSLSAVAKVNDTILSGFPYYGANNSQRGVVGIYQDINNTLTFKSLFNSPNPLDEALFGYSFLVDGNSTFISEPGNYDNGHYNATGKVYIYNDDRNGSFTLKQTLQAPDAAEANSFGSAMAFNGTYLIVGAPGADSWAGAVYFYKKDTNGSMQYLDTLKLYATSSQKFGKRVVMSDSYMIASAYSNNLYIYKINSDWNSLDPIAILNDSISDNDAVSISGNNIFIAKYGKVAGYNNLQDIIEHYQIQESGDVVLKEVLVNHKILSTTDRSAFQMLTNTDSIIVGNSATYLGDTYIHGSVTLYKKGN